MKRELKLVEEIIRIVFDKFLTVFYYLFLSSAIAFILFCFGILLYAFPIPVILICVVVGIMSWKDIKKALDYHRRF